MICAKPCRHFTLYLSNYIGTRGAAVVVNLDIWHFKKTKISSVLHKHTSSVLGAKCTVFCWPCWLPESQAASTPCGAAHFHNDASTRLTDDLPRFLLNLDSKVWSFGRRKSERVGNGGSESHGLPSPPIIRDQLWFSQMKRRNKLTENFFTRPGILDQPVFL